MQEQKFFLLRPLLTAKMAARSLLRHITARIANEQKPCKKTWGGHSVFCAVNGSLQNEILLAFNNRDRLSYKPDVGIASAPGRTPQLQPNSEMRVSGHSPKNFSPLFLKKYFFAVASPSMHPHVNP
jgi:hypothetical protein